MNLKVFGKNPSGDRLKRCEQSAHFRRGIFQNMELTTVMKKGVSMIKLFRDFIGKPKTVIPDKAIPFVETNLKNIRSDKPTVIWFGHSSYLIHSKGINILVDPVFSGNASPVTFFGKSFPGTNHYQVKDFPPIDILVITHDHYDHLDFETISAIHPNVKKIVASLGVGSHLEYWGIHKNKIIELDWWEKQMILPEIEITAAPARHFSGRGITRARTAWSSFILEMEGYRLFIGGDSGYDGQFKEIGEKFKEFDFAILECGQYNANWPNIHMFPEETVKAAGDLHAKIFMPVHWCKFALSFHPWNEPPKRLMAAAVKANQPFVIPKIGETYTIGKDYTQHPWWEMF